MENNELILFLFQISLILMTAIIFGQIMQRFRQPAIIGELIAGIILGPTVLKLIFPAFFNMVFPDSKVLSSPLNLFTQFGMLIFMFCAGLEVNLDFAWKYKKYILFTSIGGILLPLILGIGIVRALPGLFDKLPGMSIWLYSLFIGIAISISALPVIFKTLIDLNLVKTKIGIVIMSSATVNDLFGWTLFAGIIGMFKSHESIFQTITFSILKLSIFLIVIIFIVVKSGKLTSQNYEKLHAKSNNFIGVILLCILIIASIAEWLSIHPFFAVFLLGVTISRYFKLKETQIYDILNNIAIYFFAPIYFTTVGLKTNFYAHFDITIVISVILVACAGKILGSGLGAYFGGMNIKDSLCVGFGMNSRGAVEIILASVALDLNLITVKIFVALVIMAIFTSLISGPVIKLILSDEESVSDLSTTHSKNYKHMIKQK
jgi:Kef-type K+ transport system membrane component KefB